MRKLNSGFLLRFVFSFGFLALFAGLALAQTPPYYNHSSTTNVNNFPFNANPATGKRVQWIVNPGEFNQPTPLGAGNNITEIWFKASGAASPTFNNLTVKFATVPAGTYFTVGSFYTGPMTTVYTAPTTNITTVAQGWFKIVLNSAYPYDPTQSLVVEVSQCGYTGTGFGITQQVYGAAPNYRRQYSDASSPCGSVALTTGGDFSVAAMGLTVVPAVPCVTPTAQPTALTLTPAGLQQINGSFTPASPAPTNYLVVQYPNGATPVAPVSGTSYAVGSPLGTGTVISNGTGTTFSSTGLTPGTTYNYYIYSFNGGACGNAYLTTTPLTGTSTTLPCSGPPVITCPANVTVGNTTGFCGANVTYPAATATGTPTPTITYSIPSGSFFPVGTTTVTATATSICGTTNCTFTVRVNDTQGPTFSNPLWPDRLYYKFDGTGATVPNLASAPPPGTANGTLTGLTQGGTGKCGTALLGTGIAGAQMNTGWTNVNLSTPWTISFWLGPNQVDVNPSYLFGDINSGAFRAFYGGAALPNNMLLRGGSGDVLISGVNPGATMVTIVYTGTNTIVYKNGASPQTYAVTFANTGTGPFTVGGYSTLTSYSGALDEFAMYSRALTAAEVASLFATCPASNSACPSNITVSNTPGQCGAVVTYTTPVGFDNCTGGVTTTQTSGLPSGSTFPVGVTTNTFRATDAAGNITNCTFTVRVNDTQAPVITCPANMTVSTPVGSCTAVVTYTPTVTDNCSGATFVATPASGSVFNLGTTPVTVVATDASGNTSTCTFNVTVNDGQLPVMTAPPTNKTVCVGSNAVFSVTATNVVSYQWQAWNGTAFANIPGATSASYTVSNVNGAMNTNSYRVILTGLCTTVTSNHVSLYVNNLPSVTIVASKPAQLLPGEFTNLTASPSPAGTGNFVWYKNGVIVPSLTGATVSGLTVNDAGTYKVVYTDANGCTATSGDFVLSALSSDHLWVYPNPNRGDFRVRFNNLPNENVTVNIYDAKGSRIYSRQYTTGLSYTELDVSLKKLMYGRYVVEAVNSAGNRVGAKWVIIEH